MAEGNRDLAFGRSGRGAWMRDALHLSNCGTTINEGWVVSHVSGLLRSWQDITMHLSAVRGSMSLKVGQSSGGNCRAWQAANSFSRI